MKKVSIHTPDQSCASSSAPCPMVRSMQIIGGKWKLLIVYYLRDGVLRFSALQQHLPTITSKMLTQQLRELEADGVVLRTVYPVVPPKVEYSLTAKGKQLLPILSALHDWGSDVQETL